MTAEEMRREKAASRRYKKPAVKGLTFFEIRQGVDEIGEECDCVTYWEDFDDETLIDALDGDTEDADKFRMDFAVLAEGVERLQNDLREIDEPDRFDDILVAAGLGRETGGNGGGGFFGYDDYEEDYYGLKPFEESWAEEESVKRLERLTKKELIKQMAQSVSIAFSFIGIRTRYEDLKAAMDILRAQNKEYLDAVKELNRIYDSIDWSWYGPDSVGARKIDHIAEKLPPEAWL